MSFTSDIWDRSSSRARNEISANLYAFAMAGLTVVGILVSLAASRISYGWQLDKDWKVWTLFGMVLVAGIVGSLIATSSDNPWTSFAGYMLVAVPLGIMVGPVFAEYTTVSIARVFVLTTVIVAVFGVVGAVIPESLEGFGSYLFMGLLVLIVGYLFVPLAGFVGVSGASALALLDWAGIVLFCALVVYDWNKAMRLPRTMDNAVDSAVAIYLDWFNIMIRLLGRTGDRR